jgi:hypothetical protein
MVLSSARNGPMRSESERADKRLAVAVDLERAVVRRRPPAHKDLVEKPGEAVPVVSRRHVRLRLLDSTAYDSGVILLRYEPVR